MAASARPQWLGGEGSLLSLAHVIEEIEFRCSEGDWTSDSSEVVRGCRLADTP
jgi:hypothetical protein